MWISTCFSVASATTRRPKSGPRCINWSKAFVTTALRSDFGLRHRRGCDGGARLVGVEQLSQTTLVEVTTWHLDPPSGLDTTRFHRVEARRGNQSLHGCGGLL